MLESQRCIGKLDINYSLLCSFSVSEKSSTDGSSGEGDVLLEGWKEASCEMVIERP